MANTMSSKPLVSVIVPAHNAERFIRQTIESVCSQTYENIEVLVVDDGSHDRTAEIVNTIALRDHRVKLFRQAHLGLAAARNRALAESQGEYIAPIDADDIWYPPKIELQLHCMMDAAPRVGLVYSWSVYIDENGCLTGGYYAFDLPENTYAALLFRNFIGSASVPLIRRECFEHVGKYTTAHLDQHNVQGCEDLDLYLRIAENYEFRVAKEFLVGYRQSRNAMSSHSSSMARAFYLTMLDSSRRCPDIPWTIFRWSIGRQYFYLQGQARRYGQNATSIRLLLQAALFDPRQLIMWHFYRHLLGSLLLPVKATLLMCQRHKRDNTRESNASDRPTMATIAAHRENHTPNLFGACDNLYEYRLAYAGQILEESVVKSTRAKSHT